MNPWDVVTWMSSIALALSAVVIFGFFLRDADSILNREEGDPEDAATDASESDSGGERSRTTPPSPEDLSP